jgi:esterase
MNLHYSTYGTGPTLIILHGFLGSMDNWVSLCRRFSADRHVITCDARNHGRSPHDGRFDIETMARDLEELMDRLLVTSASILGHSMGGKTAMQFALTRPERVEKLIVADIAPKRYDHIHEDLLRALSGIDLTGYRERAEVDRALADDIQSVAVRQFLLKNIRRDESGRMHWKMNLPVLREQYHRVAEDVPAGGSFVHPTMFIRGERSHYILEEDRAAIVRLFPKAVIRTLPGAGHWVHADAPDMFFRVVTDFLDQPM